MPTTLPPIQERRKFSRGEIPAHLAVSLVQPDRSIAANGVNFSDGGLCLRLQQALEVRSTIRLQLAPGSAGPPRTFKPVECAARVAWVIQRLDLRDAPPFVFDVGIEFIDPPPLIRQLLGRGSRLAELKRPPVQAKGLEPSTVRGRTYAPRLERVANHAQRWHLVVMVDGVPCFSGHYGSEREAVTAWTQFKRREARR
ncbi:MAG: hypothetical protein COV75_08630 [Candidatus Omnitrophica bacterium CG11_big_fil_rev_8_21_14_0_20_63_9]|nr:MAG: hypothetical protein COV75_08630 [Candidatus Omnitrophica bacterium CG11_big_fil_rev_8_21_14_0_20_63_9]